MRRILGRIVLGFTAVVAVGLVGIAVLVATLSPDRIVADGITQIEEIGGYSVEFQPGTASVSFWPKPGIRIKGLTVRDATNRSIVSAPEAVIGLSFKALQYGEMRAGSIALLNPRMEVSADDLDRLLQDPRAGSTWGTVTSFALNGGQVRLAGNAAPIELDDVDLSINHAGPSLPTNLDGRATWKGKDVRIKVLMETLTALHGGQYALLDAKAQMGDATAAFRGRVRLAGDPFPHVRGNATIAAAQAALVNELLGQPLPMLELVSDISTEIEITTLTNRFWFKTKSTGTMNGRETVLDAVLSAGAGWMEGGDFALEIVNRTGGLYSAYFQGQTDLKNRLSGALKGAVLDVAETASWIAGTDLQSNWSRANLTADVSIVQRGIAVQSIDLKLDDNPIKGNIAADMRGERPLISASIQARNMRLPVLSWLEDGPVAEARRRLGEIAEAIALDVALDDIRLEDLDARRVDATVMQRGAEITVDAPRVDMFDGAAAVALTFEDGRPFPVEGVITAAELDMAAIAEVIGLEDLSGSFGGEIRFRLDDANGSPELVALSGDVSLVQGVIPLPDLGDVLRGQAPSQKSTAVIALNSDIRLTDGHPMFENLQIQSSDRRWAGFLEVLDVGQTLIGRLDGAPPAEGAEALVIGGRLGDVTISPKSTLASAVMQNDAAVPAPDRNEAPELATVDAQPTPSEADLAKDVPEDQGIGQAGTSAPETEDRTGEGSETAEADEGLEDTGFIDAVDDTPSELATSRSPVPLPAPR